MNIEFSPILKITDIEDYPTGGGFYEFSCIAATKAGIIYCNGGLTSFECRVTNDEDTYIHRFSDDGPHDWSWDLPEKWLYELMLKVLLELKSTESYKYDYYLKYLHYECKDITDENVTNAYDLFPAQAKRRKVLETLMIVEDTTDVAEVDGMKKSFRSVEISDPNEDPHLLPCNDKLREYFWQLKGRTVSLEYLVDIDYTDAQYFSVYKDTDEYFYIELYPSSNMSGIRDILDTIYYVTYTNLDKISTLLYSTTSLKRRAIESLENSQYNDFLDWTAIRPEYQIEELIPLKLKLNFNNKVFTIDFKGDKIKVVSGDETLYFNNIFSLQRYLTGEA